MFPRMKFLFLLVCAVLLLIPCAARAEPGTAELIVEAYVDGPSTLHLTSEGVYWTNGNNYKPGRWGHVNEPTYINNVAWKPIWTNTKETGPDKSELYPIKWGTVDVNYRLISVRQERGQTGRDKRSPVTAKHDGAEFIVIIPDPESGPRWYKFALHKR